MYFPSTDTQKNDASPRPGATANGTSTMPIVMCQRRMEGITSMRCMAINLDAGIFVVLPSAYSAITTSITGPIKPSLCVVKLRRGSLTVYACKVFSERRKVEN